MTVYIPNIKKYCTIKTTSSMHIYMLIYKNIHDKKIKY